MKLFNDYQLYLEAHRNGERNIRFESIKSDDTKYIESEPFSYGLALDWRDRDNASK